MAKILMKDGSGTFTLKYLIEDTDRHGNVRIYLRRPGHKKIRLREEPGTRAFLDEYWQAMDGHSAPVRATRPASKPVDKKSLSWLCGQYYTGADYKALSARTQYVRRGILERFCEKDGGKPYGLLETRHIRARRDTMTDRPEAANGMIKALRQLFRFAVEYGFADRNPAKDVPYLRSSSQGHHSWSFEEISAFEERHEEGSKARLALALLLYTGQRRSDIVRLGPQHLKEGWLHFTQEKNRNRKPVKMAIPVLPELEAVIDATPKENLAFLVTEFGKPFTSNGFGNWFRKRCDEAGLKHCSAHGLRKAGAALAAENGATEHQLMAIFGWSTVKEAERYTKAARQKVLAAAGMKHLRRAQNENEIVSLIPAKRGGSNTPAK